MECDKLKLLCDTKRHQTYCGNCTIWWTVVTLSKSSNGWLAQAARGFEDLSFGCMCIYDRSSSLDQRGRRAFWIKERKAKKRDQVIRRWVALSHQHTHTHTQRGCGAFAVTCVVIFQLVSKMSYVSVLTVLGGLSVSYQPLHRELCWTNVNLRLSFGDFKLEQNKESRDVNNGMMGWKRHPELIWTNVLQLECMI